MNKKIILIVIAAVVVIGGGIAAYLVYSGSDYPLYSSAFKKTFGTGSLEINTAVEANADGTDISSTGNFKIKDMTTTPQFINTMTIDGQTVTQFCDGQFIYTDDGANKNKIAMGETPAPRQEKESSAGFSLDTYISEFSGLLDASKIRELNSLEPIDERYVDSITSTDIAGGKQFDVVLLPQAVDALVDSFLSENISDASLEPTVAVGAVSYRASIVSGFVSEIAINVDMDVTAPGESEAQAAQVRFSLRPVNPGQAVEITLPSTEGF